MNERYGHERIRRGLMNFVLGKGVSAIAGMFAMLLVIRALSVPSFAAYSVLVALVELLTAISGLGLAHALLRYVPELYAQHFQISLRKFVYGSIGLRSAVLLIAASFAYLFADHLAPLIGLGNVIEVFQVFLLVVVLRSSSQFLSQILESTLHQGNAQAAFSINQIARLVGMIFLLQNGEVQLIDAIWVECIGESLGLLVMSYGVIQVVRSEENDKRDSGDDGNWLRSHLKQIAKFALAGYLQHLAIMPYGGNTNRLVGGGMLNAGGMASFGFAQSLYEYLKRYLPAQLLVGLIRPVVVARYCESQDFSVAANLCERVLQINILLIVGVLALLTVGGGDALAVISAGKYGSGALAILTLLIVVLMLETQRQQLELLVQTVERYHFLIPSNLLLSSSVVLAIILLPWLGAAAFPAANAIGLIAGNTWVQRQMRSAGFDFKHDWFSILRIAALYACAVLCGEAVRIVGLPWYISTLAALVVYAGLAYLVCGKMVRGFVRELTNKNRSRLPVLDDAPSPAPPRIAFGVLSSKQSANAIDEIAGAVFPHAVFVHHDFSKQPDFAPTAANIHVLAHPVVTAWGDWSLVEATFSLMKTAMEDSQFTHFQLLSEACLPVRPIREFENFLVAEQPDVMIDALSMKDNEAMFSHGWRYFQNSRRSLRILRAASNLLWGEHIHFRATSSINLRLTGQHNGIVAKCKRMVGNLIVRAFAQSAHEMLAESGLKQFAIGGQWFGASRRMVKWLLQAREEFANLTRHYQRSHIPDESYLHTLVLNAQLAGLPLRVFPNNHALFWDGCGNGPDTLIESDVQRIKASGKFFARKFPLGGEGIIRRAFMQNKPPADANVGPAHSRIGEHCTSNIEEKFCDSI
jgi:O-antigen/teichoic acid export membrane protein